MRKVGTALITGATSGIGLEMSKIFAQSKIPLLLIARNEQNLLAIKQDIENCYGVKVSVLALDLSNLENITKVETYVSENNLEIDFLVNNAGFGDFGYFTKRDFSSYSEMINLNITALSILTHIFAKKMVENRNGKILNIASIAGLQPLPNMAVYGATKAYVLMFSDALGFELKDTNVSVTALLPGPTETNFFKRGDGLKSRMRDHSMSAEKVAKIGYRAMIKGKRRVVAGGRNRILAFLVKILPINNFLLGIAKKITEDK